MPRLREEKRLREQRIVGIKTGIPTYVSPELTTKGFKLLIYNTSQLKVGELGADVQCAKILEVDFELLDFGCGAFSFTLDSLPTFEIGYRTRVDIFPYFDTMPWYSGFIQKIPKPGQRPPYRYMGFGFFEQLDWVLVSSSYADQELSLIIKNIIENKVAPNTQIAYNSQKIEQTNYTVNSIAFENVRAKDAIQQLSTLVSGYEFGVDNVREFYFRKKNADTKYAIWAGKHFEDIELEEDPLSVRNKLYVKAGKIQSGGTNYIGTVADSSSIATYGLREEVVTAPDILDSTDALAWAQQILDEKKNPKIKAKIQNIILDDTKTKIEPSGKIRITAYEGSSYELPVDRVFYHISKDGILAEVDCAQNPHHFEEILVKDAKELDEERRLGDNRIKDLEADISALKAAVAKKIEILDTETNILAVANSSNENIAYQYTVASLGANDAMRVTVLGRYRCYNIQWQWFRFRIKLGTTIIWQDVTPDYDTSAEYYYFRIEFILQNAGSQSLQKLHGVFHIGNLLAGEVGRGDITEYTNPNALAIIASTSSVDMSQAQTLAVTIQMESASANLQWERYFAMVEKLPNI